MRNDGPDREIQECHSEWCQLGLDDNRVFPRLERNREEASCRLHCFSCFSVHTHREARRIGVGKPGITRPVHSDPQFDTLVEHAVSEHLARHVSGQLPTRYTYYRNLANPQRLRIHLHPSKEGSEMVFTHGVCTIELLSIPSDSSVGHNDWTLHRDSALPNRDLAPPGDPVGIKHVRIQEEGQTTYRWV